MILVKWITKIIVLQFLLKMQMIEDKREPEKKDDMYLRSKL